MRDIRKGNCRQKTDMREKKGEEPKRNEEKNLRRRMKNGRRKPDRH